MNLLGKFLLLISVSINSLIAFSGTNTIISGSTFTVMTYNLENLFDHEHDEGKLDYSYLPLSVKNSSEVVQEYCKSIRSNYYRQTCFTLDWNREVVLSKISQISKVIKSLGTTPDILVLEEVENIKVLKMLMEIGLAGEGYREAILVEGPDVRGIDVGIISKFPLAKKVKYHDIDLTPAFGEDEKVKLTRGILEATLNIRGRHITIMANHWPSQRNSDFTRVISAKTLLKAISPIKNPVIVAGDFNTLVDDNPHSINQYLLYPESGLGFYDIEKVFFGEQNIFLNYQKNILIEVPRGTHHYRGKWSSLDRIFVLKKYLNPACNYFGKCFKVLWNNYSVIKKPFMLHNESYQDDSGRDIFYENVPWRFDAETGEGYSDHLPVISTFYIR